MLGMRKPSRQPVILTGIAVSALLAGGGVAMAATGGSSAPQAGTISSSEAAATPAPSASPPAPVPRARGPVRRFAIGPFGAVHGQFVVAKPGGGYQTIDTQRGAVTAVSTSSITVKSGDGFTKTYRVTSTTNVNAQRDGISSIKTGQQVTVIATVNGGTATATSITDFSLLPKFPGTHAGPAAGWQR